MSDIEYDKNKNKEYKLACGKCDGETYHKVLSSVHTHESGNDIDVWRDFEIVCCQGCREISYRSNTLCSENIWFNPETGEQSLEDDVEIYPNRIGRKQIKDMYFLPDIVLGVYKETYRALCSELNILAGIGIRLLVESVCKEKGANGANLEEKIDALVNNGILTKDNAEILHSTRLMGNKAAHEILPPIEEELGTAMDIVENLLRTVYIIPKEAIRLPKRKQATMSVDDKKEGDKLFVFANQKIGAREDDHYFSRNLTLKKLSIKVRPTQEYPRWRLGLKFSLDGVFTSARYDEDHILFHLTKDQGRERLDYHLYEGGKPKTEILVPNYQGQTICLEVLTNQTNTIIKMQDANGQAIKQIEIPKQKSAQLFAWADGQSNFELETYINEEKQQ